MGLTIKGKVYSVIPEEVYVAVCYSVIDLGHQLDKKGEWNQRVQVTWELPDLRIEDGRPTAISNEYFAVISEKSLLGKTIATWTGVKPDPNTGFDMKTLLGRNCQLQVVHNESNGKTFANIGAIIKLPSIVPVRAPENPIVYFEIESETIPENIPEWVQKKIMASKEWQERLNPAKKVNDVVAAHQAVEGTFGTGAAITEVEPF